MKQNIQSKQIFSRTTRFSSSITTLFLLVFTIQPTCGVVHQPSSPYDVKPRNYQFSWAVNDVYSGNNYGHSERRSDGNTEGKYYVTLPDGRIQRVVYSVDPYSGFNAKINYDVSNALTEGQKYSPIQYEPSTTTSKRPYYNGDMIPGTFKPQKAVTSFNYRPVGGTFTSSRPSFNPQKAVTSYSYKPVVEETFKASSSFKPQKAVTSYTYKPVVGENFKSSSSLKPQETVSKFVPLDSNTLVSSLSQGVSSGVPIAPPVRPLTSESEKLLTLKSPTKVFYDTKNHKPTHSPPVKTTSPPSKPITTEPATPTRGLPQTPLFFGSLQQSKVPKQQLSYTSIPTFAIQPTKIPSDGASSEPVKVGDESISALGIDFSQPFFYHYKPKLSNISSLKDKKKGNTVTKSLERKSSVPSQSSSNLKRRFFHERFIPHVGSNFGSPSGFIVKKQRKRSNNNFLDSKAVVLSSLRPRMRYKRRTFNYRNLRSVL